MFGVTPCLHSPPLLRAWDTLCHWSFWQCDVSPWGIGNRCGSLLNMLVHEPGCTIRSPVTDSILSPRRGLTKLCCAVRVPKWCCVSIVSSLEVLSQPYILLVFFTLNLFSNNVLYNQKWICVCIFALINQKSNCFFCLLKFHKDFGQFVPPHTNLAFWNDLVIRTHDSKTHLHGLQCVGESSHKHCFPWVCTHLLERLYQGQHPLAL